MGYEIEYDEENIRRRMGKGPSLFVPMTAAAWLAFLLLVGAFWPKGESVLRGMFPAVRAAFQQFEEDLQEGADFSDSFQVFCEDLI